MNRYYICDNCEHSFVAQQPMHEPLKKKCPQCGKFSLYQDLTGQHVFIYQDPKTVGHQAERNRTRMGKYELETKDKAKKKKNAPWYNPEGKDLKKELSGLNSPEKVHQYVKDGVV